MDDKIKLSINIWKDHTINLYSMMATDEHGRELVMECLSQREVESITLGEMLKFLKKGM